MKQFILTIESLSPAQVQKKLGENHIFINYYAKQFFSHPLFSSGYTGTITVSIAALDEIGFENGATLDEILKRLPSIGLKPCPPDTGLFLRLAWLDQPQSQNSILSGTHRSPDQAVTVFSTFLEHNDDFPKGLYLRNVDGNLWLRGYICNDSYHFPKDALFAFESIMP